MKIQKDRSSGIVYSTEHGRMCADCSRPIAECVCGQNESTFKGDGIVRVGRERKGRKGKSVTIITGVALGRQQLVKLAKELKKKCGTGGTVKDGVIEIQGNHLSLLVEELKKRGWTVKRSGG